MSKISGGARGQLQNFEDLVYQESMVMVIDYFVETIDVNHLGFIEKSMLNIGRPAFDVKVLITCLWLYVWHKKFTQAG